MNQSKRWITVGRHVVLIIMTLIVLMPFLWTFLSTVRPRNQLMSAQIFPALSDLTLENYATVLGNDHYIAFLKNSVVYSTCAAALAVCIGLLAAYGFARINFAGKKAILNSFIIIMMIPALVVMVPLYMLFSKLKLLNPVGLILIYAAGNIPFCLWLIKSFIDSIPYEIDEAAYLDGCTKLGTMWHIAFPLAKAGLASAFIIVFINSWNELMYAETFLNDLWLKPVTSGILLWKGSHGTDWAGLNTAAIFACVPVLIVFFLLQDYFVNGLISGSMKG